MQRGPFTFTRGRILQAVAIVLLAVAGAPLPYLTLTFENYASQVVRETHALWPAAHQLGVLNISYLPAAAGATPDQLQHGVDLVHLGARAQEVGVVVAVLTVWCLFMDEINKFAWWPLHLSGWLLCLGTVSLWAGALLLRSHGVDVHLSAGWLPLLADGVLILVVTLRSWSRVDRTRGI